MKHVNIHVHGRVQGVFYRTNAQEEAERLSIAGFARNDPDGSVYIEAEGEDAAIDRFIKWCRSGPRTADVDDISVETDEVQDYTEFTTL